jgi:16S rRNA (guanine966-N2)-methyltransferase
VLLVVDAGRVIAGSARGVRLRGPGAGTRPLADRVKQAIFGMLEPDLPDSRVLDLFAGSGAGGIEALSRGAAGAVFVERRADAARIIAENLSRAHLADRARVVRADAVAYLADRAAADGPFDLVLVDPPYADVELMNRTLMLLGQPGALDQALLSPEATVVARYFWRNAPPQGVGLLASVRTRRFGEAGVTFYVIGRAGTVAGGAEEEPEETAT